ncbi:MAG: hypothetical protein AAB116_11090 [Candidatus Poribacteria bacterium]
MKEALFRHGFLIITTVSMIMVFSISSMAQQGDIIAGLVAGEQMAKTNVNAGNWFLVGCLGGGCYIVGGLAGLAYASNHEPQVPVYHVLGKSVEYGSAFTESYRKTAKKIQVRNTWKGVGVSCLLYGIIILSAYLDNV